VFNDKNILVTGGRGFIGSNLVHYLCGSAAKVRIVSRNKPRGNKGDNNSCVNFVYGDLTRIDDCQNAVKDIDYVFHLASSGGGLIYNMKHPAETFTPNILMNTNMLEASKNGGVERYLFCSSSSVYPPDLDLLEEDKAWQANPHESDSFFSWSKRMGELQALAYKEEYGMKIAIARLGNPYGPRDNFDPDSAHVIPALIVRAVSKDNPFVVWGSGEGVRSFVHVKDVVEALALIIDRYAVCDPVNVASGESVRIKDVVQLILEITDYHGDLEFDTSKKEGHLFKVMSIEKLIQRVGYTPKINLREGLKDTIEWYMQHKYAAKK